MGRDGELTLFFATDLHGSLVCFRKFLQAPSFYDADEVILGGDLTGKMIVPVIRQPGGGYTATLAGQDVEVSEDGVEVLETRIADSGFYPYRTDPDEVAELKADRELVDRLFVRVMTETLRAWHDLAERALADTERVIYVAPGNDDPFEIDDVLAELPRFRVVEGEVIRLGDRYEMLNTGYTNHTPWETHREYEEKEIQERIEKLAGRITTMSSAIFNIHPPPYDSGLDWGPDIDPVTWQQRSTMGQGHQKPVGSTAVRKALETYQPLLSLHGHIHESAGIRRIGRTIAINPGSDYSTGALNGALITLERDKVSTHQLVRG